MKTAALVKRSPTLITFTLLSYACYSVNASVADLDASRAAVANGLDVMIKDVITSSKDEVQSLSGVMLRDPFRIAVKATEVSKTANEPAPADSKAEGVSEFVQSLTLDATFLQGKTRLAIISGRIYHQGQHLVIRGESGPVDSPLLIRSVQAHGVTLGAHGKTYVLGYPEHLGNRQAPAKDRGKNSADGTLSEVDPEGELAFYKRLLNSPLGKMGKSLTGNMGSGASRATRSRGARGGGSNSSQ
jgi:hypothetical protein